MFSSVLSMSVSVECGVLSVEYDSAVSGEPPKFGGSHGTLQQPEDFNLNLPCRTTS
jgi:hypothetical protein